MGDDGDRGEREGEGHTLRRAVATAEELAMMAKKGDGHKKYS